MAFILTIKVLQVGIRYFEGTMLVSYMGQMLCTSVAYPWVQDLMKKVYLNVLVLYNDLIVNSKW